MLVLFGMFFVAWWALVAFVVVIDPLDLYPWGITPRLAERDYATDAAPYLVSVIAKDPKIDTVMIGASTEIPITRQMLRENIVGAHDAFNLSYRQTRPADRNITLQKIAAAPHIRNVIIALDYIYLFPPSVIRADFPSYLYDDNDLNDIRTIGLQSVQLALASARGEPTWVNAWDYSRREGNSLGRYKRFQSPEAQEKLARILNANRAVVDRPTQRTCKNLATINDQLKPAVAKLSAEGRNVVILIPPYSPAAYYMWLNVPNISAVLNHAILENALLLRKCTVEALADMAGVRIFGFDNDQGMTGSIANYHDEAHLYGDKNYMFLMRAIHDGTHRLTRANIDAYIETMRARVKAYRLSAPH